MKKILFILLFFLTFSLSIKTEHSFAVTNCTPTEYASHGPIGTCYYPRNYYKASDMGNVTWTTDKQDFCQTNRPGTNCPNLPGCNTINPGTTEALQNPTNISECIYQDATDLFRCCYIPPAGVSPEDVPADLKNPCPNGQCVTSLGIIKTDPGSFIQVLFGILLGISGGIAIIMIIIAGYNYALSQGNPEKIKEAQEMLVTAIVGLLFIIFSTVILQIIGIDIFKLPGFSR